MLLIFIKKNVPLLVLMLIAYTLSAQEPSEGFFQLDEKLLIESKWQYVHTLHVESNTAIHNAENKYDYYIYFRYDFTYQEFLNDRLNKGKWKLKGNTLKYSFKEVNAFEVIELNETTLVLEYEQAKNKYQYHFKRVDDKDAPFKKPSNELPEVLVEADDSNALGKKKKTGVAIKTIPKK